MPHIVFKFSNGDRVKDTVTGFKGIITSSSFHLNGCVRYGVEPKAKKDDMGKAWAFDEGQLELVEAAVVNGKQAATPTGGPQRELHER